MTRKPLILIAWGACVDPHFLSQGMMLTKAYGWVITANGGLPVVPLDVNLIEQYCEIADGLLLPGGMLYIGLPFENDYSNIECHARKEDFENRLYESFKKTGKPIFGICDGEQKINSCQGGRLELVAEKFGTTHFLTAHPIQNEKESMIGDAWGENAIINSYHELSIDSLGEDLKVTSRSPEGVIEAIEHRTLPIYGVQFHPERMRGDNIFPAEGNDGDLLIRAFINKCLKLPTPL